MCDLCSNRIVGEWFRCIYCAKDYCDDCESLGGHNPTHVFAIFKSRVGLCLRILTNDKFLTYYF